MQAPKLEISDTDSNKSESRDKFQPHPTKTRGGAIKVNDTYYQEPPDGGWGWVIVMAVWVDNMCVLGMLKSFPVLYGAFKEQSWEDATPETLNFKISLISSLSLSMRATCAPLAAALTNKYNERTTVTLGAFLIVTGLFCCQFATKIWHLYLSMGIIAGMGFAFASMPALALIGRYFNKKRSLANGVSRSGGGAFFFLSPFLIYLSGQETSFFGMSLGGWKFTLAVCAVIELLLLGCAVLFRPVKLKCEVDFDPKTTLLAHRETRIRENVTRESELEKLTDTPQYAVLSADEIRSAKTNVKSKIMAKGMTESVIADNFPNIKPIYKAKPVQTLDFSMIKNMNWLMVTANLVMTQFAYSACLIHLTPRIQTVMEETDPSVNCSCTSDNKPVCKSDQDNFSKSTLMMIVGLCEILSQLSSATIGDKKWLPRIRLHQIYISVMMVGTVLSIVLPQQQYMLMFYSAIFGLGAGAWQANILPVTADALGILKLRSAYGLCLFCSGVFGQLPGAPFIGIILDSLICNPSCSDGILVSGSEGCWSKTDAYRLAYGVMAAIFCLAISVLFLNNWAEKYEGKKVEDETDKIPFEITGSIQVDINTLLCEFPKDPRSQAPSRRESRIPFGLFSSRGSIFKASASPDGSKNRMDASYNQGSGKNITRSVNIVNSLDVFDAVKSNSSLQVPSQNYGLRRQSKMLDQQAVITDSDGNICQMVPMGRKNSILNYMS